MEDWERAFAEKSSRRYEADELQRHRRRLEGMIATILILLLLIGSVVGLVLLR